MITNYQNLGSAYTESGKFDLVRLIIFTIIGYFVFGALGVGYGLLTDINPIIYLNLIILIGAVFALVIVIKLFASFGKLRNRYISMCLGVFYGAVFTYNAWSAIYAYSDQSVFGGLFFQHSLSEITQLISMRNLSIGKIGRNGAGLGEGITSIIYLIECLILIIAPSILLVKDPNYYCEECDKSMDSEEHYFEVNPENETELKSDLNAGKLSNLFQLSALEESQLKANKSYIHLNYHTCKNCNKLVFSADQGKGKIEKDKSSFDKDKRLHKNIYGAR